MFCSIHICKYECVCEYVIVRMYVSVCMCVRMYIFMCVYVSLCALLCVYVSMCVILNYARKIIDISIISGYIHYKDCYGL